MTVASQREHTDGVIAKLVAAGLVVGDGEAPDAEPPYAVVHSIPGGSATGSIEEPHEDGELVYQVTCVGTTREQAEWVADESMVLLEGITVEGRSIPFVDLDTLSGARRDTTVTPALWICTPRFRIKTTPA